MLLLDRIKQLCADKGISINDLERKCELGKNTVYRWDNACPSADKLVAVAKVLGTTVEELLKE